MELNREKFPSSGTAEGAVQSPLIRRRQEVDSEELMRGLNKIYGNISEENISGLVALGNVNGLKKVFADGELMRTALSFINNSLNISKAARALYMHRNTMMYRLEKIRRLTGFNIKRFDDAVAFEILYKAFRRSEEVI